MPIVVHLKETSEFIAIESLAEAKKYEETGDEILIWDNGIWRVVEFVVLKGQNSRAIGFKSAE